jgi:hypothetical protein
MRIVCWCVVVGLIFPSAVFSQSGEDEVQKLKAEIAKLREENAQLKKELDRLLGPPAKFEQVLWHQSEGDKKGTLYLVIAVPGGELRKQMEGLGPYAAAALKEAVKAPVKDPNVVFVLKPPVKAPNLPCWVRVAGFSVKDLERIAAAPPEQRAAKFLFPAWTLVVDAIPKEATPLPGQ